jgi:hypothetical protein
MNTKHTPITKSTPGPWQYYWRLDKQEHTDCGVFWEKHKGQAYSVCRAPRYEQKEQWEANARLIAAAPDLLEALLVVMSYPVVRNCLEVEHNDAARAAIAKATGEKA